MKVLKSVSEYISLLLIMLIVTLMFSCSKDDDNLKGRGVLAFSLSTDTTGVNDNSSATKSTLDDFEPFLNIDLYLIEILEGEKEEVVETYEHYGDMPEEIELPSGNYKIRASYGELKAVAFDAPRFEGKTDFIIKDDMSTRLDIVCALANARLTVSYSDSLKMTYPTHSSMFVTDFVGEDTLSFMQDEARSGWFLVSSTGTDLKGVITVVDPLGAEQQFRVSLPSVKPKDNINLIFNSAPNEQSVKVKVTINEVVIDCPVYVFIPDYMLPVDAPILKTTGFADGYPIALALGDPVPEVKVDVRAPGTIENVFLSVWEEANAAGVIEYDLANLTQSEQIALTTLGLDVPVDMLHKKKVVLDFKPVIEKLERIASDVVDTKIYHYKLVVKDSLVNANTSAPVTLTIRMIPDVAPKIELSDGFANSLAVEIAEGGIYFKDVAKVYPAYEAKINTKEGILLTEVRLKVTDDVGGFIIYDLISGSPLLPSGITYDPGTKTVSYKESVKALIVEPGRVRRQEYELTAKTENFGETYEAVQTLIIDIVPPKFAMQMNDDFRGNGDAFARRAILRAYSQTGVTERLKFQVQHDGVSWVDVIGQAQVKGDMAATLALNLNTETQYTVRALYGNHISEITTFTTEGIAILPNSGFESWYGERTDRDGNAITKNLKHVYWNKYFPWSKDNASSKGWNTLNQKTTQDGATPTTFWGFPTSPYVGTSYVANSGTIPTTDKRSGNKAALVRSVGWGSGNAADGTPPQRTDPGLLYLGKCDQKTFEPIYGVDFSTRPTAISFYCKYFPYNSSGDKFIAEVIIYDREGREVGVGRLTEGGIGAYAQRKVVIDYNETAGKAAKIHILFKSGTCLTPNQHFDYPKGANLSDEQFLGSKLYVDDVELIYE